MASILKTHQQTQASTASGGPQGLAGFNLDDLAQAGLRQIKTAEAEAAKILRAAEEEGKRIRARAEDEGKRAGFQAGMKEAEAKIRGDVAQQLSEQIPALEATVEQISEIYQQYLDEFRSLLVPTALGAAERIVLARLEQDGEVLTRWAAAALDAARTSPRLTLVVHPETLTTHGDALRRLLAAPSMPHAAELETDESVAPHSVLVRTDGGSVRLSLREQIARLDEMLRGEGAEADWLEPLEAPRQAEAQAEPANEGLATTGESANGEVANGESANGEVAEQEGPGSQGDSPEGTASP